MPPVVRSQLASTCHRSLIFVLRAKKAHKRPKVGCVSFSSRQYPLILGKLQAKVFISVRVSVEILVDNSKFPLDVIKLAFGCPENCYADSLRLHKRKRGVIYTT